MLETDRPDEMKIMLLRMAAASAGVPERRERLIRCFRAALSLLEDEDEDPPARDIRITPEVRRALTDLATSLNMAAEHADFLAEQATCTRRS